MELDELFYQLGVMANTGDGTGFASFFTTDAVFHDGFYGINKGRDAIRDMIEGGFHRDAEDIQFVLFDGIRQGDLAYAQFYFSYTAKIEGSEGRRVVFDAMCKMQFEGDKICDFYEIIDSGAIMTQLGFTSDRILGQLEKRSRRLRDRPELMKYL